ncbi:SDR family oxidoreductase [Sphingomonas jatrophae]|uniref:NAD(P)-dependent dehydrogenase, short-chain alcohol dehydrogenase family n=1 Tax=Sphingomonas jatrophae TaxID=1166337 RepID=A0A1I6KKS5_9SPHN|nr:SDR family oxidoreductase [Sphingomonas jatrophae]SFR91863.1 NAD(P)-dependent dehydrogenase, short-chain alcohol dehydrogenase family [Sphingomonas jatrophae]
MQRTFLLTGSASGIGRATAERLRADGERVIGVDLRNADIEVDLGTPDGRAKLAEEAARMAPDGLDGVLAGAGISGQGLPRETIAINYFGAVATLTGLHPLMAKKPRARAVAICSTAALLPHDEAVIQSCLAGDEAAALEGVMAQEQTAYMTSKRALSLWVRRTAVSKEWGGRNILLNGVAPGVIKTPMTMPLFDDPEMIRLMALSNPMGVEGYAEADEIAELIAYLLRFEGHYLVGQVIFNDGGTDAIMRPDHF